MILSPCGYPRQEYRKSIQKWGKGEVIGTMTFDFHIMNHSWTHPPTFFVGGDSCFSIFCFLYPDYRFAQKSLMTRDLIFSCILSVTQSVLVVRL